MDDLGSKLPREHTLLASQPINDNRRIGNRLIVVAPNSVLLNPIHAQRTAIALKNTGITRRNVPEWMATTTFGHMEHGGWFEWPGGAPFEISDTAIDDSYNNEASCWWFGEFMRRAEIGFKQTLQARLASRLRLIDLAFAIDMPDVWRHFAR